MPLLPGASQATVGTNIKEMMAAGHPQNQAVAASLHNADKYKKPKTGLGSRLSKTKKSG